MNSLSEPILTQVQTRKIPATSFMRTWCLGTTQAKIAASYISYAVQQNFLNEDQKRLARDRANLKSALQLLGTMGYLRGAIMKVGQLLANLPQIMGPDLVEILESLHFEAPPMHYALIREVFLDELGKEPDEVFQYFDRRAFAAASLGQVHRAQLYDGTEVAVKIQYPDIGRTIEADFKTLGVLLQPMRFKKDFHILLSHILDAREVFSKEVDYLSEAAYMEKNRKMFTGTAVVVPKSYPDLTSKRVLTMDYLPGRHLQEFLTSEPPQHQRDHFGELISFALVHSFFRAQTIYADLHPGNFIFMDDGRLGFIDFGCFRRFSPERWRFEMASEMGMIADDRKAMLHFLAKVSLHDSPEELDSEWREMGLRQVKWIIAPIVSPGPFDFADREYVQEGVELYKEIIRSGYARFDCFYNWTNRALLGHRSLMYRLGCKIDYSALYLQELKRALRHCNLS